MKTDANRNVLEREGVSSFVFRYKAEFAVFIAIP